MDTGLRASLRDELGRVPWDPRPDADGREDDSPCVGWVLRLVVGLPGGRGARGGLGVVVEGAFGGGDQGAGYPLGGQ